jgi:hypothetical protein
MFEIGKLEKYPDLWRRFNYITPLPDIKIKVTLKFYSPETSKEIAVCQHLINIDLASPAFIKDNFSLPGSSDWDEMFTDMTVQDPQLIERKTIQKPWWNKNEKDFKRNMIQLFGSSNRIEIFYPKMNISSSWSEIDNGSGVNVRVYSPKIIELEWNTSEIKDILDEYCRREEKANQAPEPKKEENIKASEDDYWKTAADKPKKNQATDDDYWNTVAATPNEWLGKIDKAEDLYAQKDWKAARDLYQQVSAINPSFSYAVNKVKYIDKLMAYKPKIEADFVAVQAETRPNLYGFKDKQGKLVIDYQYDIAFNFCENLAKVGKSDGNIVKFGFISGENQMIVDPIYNNVLNFSEGKAAVNLNNKWGFVDQNGQLTIPCMYDYVENFIEGKSYVETVDEKKRQELDRNCEGGVFGAYILLITSKNIDGLNTPVSNVLKSYQGGLLEPSSGGLYLTSAPSRRLTAAEEEAINRRKERERQIRSECRSESNRLLNQFRDYAGSKGYSQLYNHTRKQQ